MSDDRCITKIMACNNSLLFGAVAENSFLPLMNLKSLEKLFLKKMKEIVDSVIDPLCQQQHLNKLSNDANTEAMERLRDYAKKVILFVVQNIQTSWTMVSLDQQVQKMPLIKSPEEFAVIMENYAKAACDCLVVDVIKLEHDSKVYQATLDILKRVCHANEESTEDILQKVLLDPANQLNHYLSCLQSMILGGRKVGTSCVNNVLDAIEKAHVVLKTSQKAIERECKQLMKTRVFWEMAGSKLASLKRPKRRLILDSKDCPINVANANTFTKHWIILMNDILIQAGYIFNSHVVHPLKTVWVESHQVMSPTSTSSERGNRQESKDLEITLVLPEETLVLSAQDYESKNEWLNKLQRQILASLALHRTPEAVKNYTPPITRNTTYTFNKVPDLRGAEYSGKRCNF